MIATILHLSDIHIRSENDFILNKAELIASSVYQDARNSDICLILITGDIAFSGNQTQYNIALNFLNTIKTKIQNDSGISVDIITTPGNHDCCFSENIIRDTLIEKVIENNSLAESREIIDTCTMVQASYFDFQSVITDEEPIHSHKLWNEYEFKIKEKTIKISTINAAWMSQLNETQGQLVFPVNLISSHTSTAADLKISLIHHPLNWYAQNSYHPLRAYLRGNYDVILSGHEHSISSGEIKDSRDGACLYFEAPALQPHEPLLTPSYTVLSFNLNRNIVEEKVFNIENDKIHLKEKSKHHDLAPSLKKHTKKHDLKDEIVCNFSDSGGNFSHPQKNHIVASDIFIYPELEERDKESQKTISADEINLTRGGNKKTLILGDEKSGKTFLLHKLFLDSHASGMVPLYLNAGDLGIINNQNIESKIELAISRQYKNNTDYNLAEKEIKIAFLDDLDRSNTNGKTKNILLNYLENNFGKIIATASPDIEINDLLEANSSELLSEYDTYEIKPFGHRMRHKLIKKWCLCGDLETKTDLDKKTHHIENLLNAVIGKNFVPSRPIYLLILLQSTESNDQGELESSSFSYYYQYLITKSLSEVGIKGNQLGEVFNYLSQLAWTLKNSGKKELNRVELVNFNSAFSNRYVYVDFEGRTKLLEKAKILLNSDEHYSFRYPYIYYFFVGKYLSTKLHLQETKELISEYCQNLHKKENSDCILFLTHHQNDTWITDKVSETMNAYFSEVKNIELNGDISTLNTLVNISAELVISEIDVPKAQEEQRRAADEADELENELDDENSEKSSFNDTQKKLNSLIKTAEILGQISKNYYGVIEREKKEAYIESVFNGPLRMLKILFNEILRDPNSFVKNIESTIREKSQKNDIADIEKLAKQAAFNLIGLVCTGMIARTAQFVNSDKLSEDLATVISKNNTNAYRLIGAALYLMKPGRIPFEDLKKLSGDLKDNIFAFKILQSLVVYHLHMFHTKDSDKQKLCEYTNIKMEEVRKIDFKSQKRKLLVSE